MPDPLVVTFPGSAFKAQMQSLQKILLNSIKRREVLPIATVMDYINLTATNVKLKNLLIARGNFIPNGDILANDYKSTLFERLYDTGEQLKEVYLQFPKKLRIKITEPAANTIVMDFRAGSDVIVIAKGLPESTGLSESFIAETLTFHPDGTETILKEEFGDGIIKILVDYTKPMDSSIRVKYDGNSFKSRFLNTLSYTMTDDPCCPGPIIRPRKGRGIINIHVKTVYPLSIPINTLVSQSNLWLDAYNLEIRVQSITNLLNLTQFQVLDLRLANPTQYCLSGGQVSTEQQDLYINHRGAIPANEIAVYFVQSTIPATNGCAAHPTNIPSVAVAYSMTQYTLAHELCHVLGLNHVNDNYRLMTGNGTANIISPPPDLVNSELNTIWQSNYLQIIN